jgi:hypothetical protein
MKTPAHDAMPNIILDRRTPSRHDRTIFGEHLGAPDLAGTARKEIDLECAAQILENHREQHRDGKQGVDPAEHHSSDGCLCFHVRC